MSPARTPRTTSSGEVNERYRQHPATGSFAVDTEGEITRWDTSATHRSRARRPHAYGEPQRGRAGTAAGPRRRITDTTGLTEHGKHSKPVCHFRRIHSGIPRKHHRSLVSRLSNEGTRGTEAFPRVPTGGRPMKVTTAALPLLPVCQRLLPALPALPGLSGLPGVPGLPGLSGLAALPGRLTGLSMNLLKASALEVAILAGHLLLYPSGIVQERRSACALPSAGRPTPGPRLPRPGSPRAPSPRSSCCTVSSTTVRSSCSCAAAWPSTAGSRSSH